LQQGRFVDALGEHMPGLAKAVEITVFSHGDIIEWALLRGPLHPTHPPPRRGSSTSFGR
jgi:hypothetical protein